jgi:hypothetical protein
MTPRDYLKMLESQNNACAICKKDRSEFPKNFAVDHNHITGEIRGLLCGPCNTSIGVFGVDSNLDCILRAVEYCQKTRQFKK